MASSATLSAVGLCVLDPVLLTLSRRLAGAVERGGLRRPRVGDWAGGNVLDIGEDIISSIWRSALSLVALPPLNLDFGIGRHDPSSGDASRRRKLPPFWPFLELFLNNAKGGLIIGSSSSSYLRRLLDGVGSASLPLDRGDDAQGSVLLVVDLEKGVCFGGAGIKRS